MTIERVLSCPLTNEEFVVRSIEHAKLGDEIERAEDEMKAAARSHKDRIGGLRQRERELREVVRTRQERRTVECEWHSDWASKSMILRRKDTGEAVEVRAMTPDELQKSFDLSPEDRRLPEHRDEGDDGITDAELDG